MEWLRTNRSSSEPKLQRFEDRSESNCRWAYLSGDICGGRMKVNLVDGQSPVKEKSVTQWQNGKNNFSKLLDDRVSKQHSMVNPTSGDQQGKNDTMGKKSQFLYLGRITDRIPTVSNLLIRHPSYRKNIWNIIHSARNKDKPYTKIQPGTDVYLNPETREIVWNREGFHTAKNQKKELERSVIHSDTKEKSDRKAEAVSKFVKLGMISRSNPTVSHILRRHPAYKQMTYQIIQSEINQGKTFTKMVEGTDVYLNSETLEVVWDRGIGKQDTTFIAHDMIPLTPDVQREIPKDTDPFSDDLVKSVKYFVGSSYEDIDCFELVVRGLNKMGIDYKGNGGLQNQLVRMAVAKGLPRNAYLNGEGLVKASGTQVYFKSISKIQDSEIQASEIFEEMEPFLKKGFILSFSTRTRGHTGIVSQKDRSWTYINSGTMDHRIGGRRDQKGVGEELLTAEIRNWVRVAANNDESLKITLGRLDAEKLLGVET
jgi:hypothetical protein